MKAAPAPQELAGQAMYQQNRRDQSQVEPERLDATPEIDVCVGIE
jgi:hypothetical protein